MKIKELRNFSYDYMICKELVVIFTSEGQDECEFLPFQSLGGGAAATVRLWPSAAQPYISQGEKPRLLIPHF
jgi:hypothetical protein